MTISHDSTLPQSRCLTLMSWWQYQCSNEGCEMSASSSLLIKIFRETILTCQFEFESISTQKKPRAYANRKKKRRPLTKRGVRKILEHPKPKGSLPDHPKAIDPRAHLTYLTATPYCLSPIPDPNGDRGSKISVATRADEVSSRKEKQEKILLLPSRPWS